MRSSKECESWKATVPRYSVLVQASHYSNLHGSAEHKFLETTLAAFFVGVAFTAIAGLATAADFPAFFVFAILLLKEIYC